MTTKRDVHRRVEELEDVDDFDELSIPMVLSHPDRYEDVEGHDHLLRDTETDEIGRVPWVKELTN